MNSRKPTIKTYTLWGQIYNAPNKDAVLHRLNMSITAYNLKLVKKISIDRTRRK